MYSHHRTRIYTQHRVASAAGGLGILAEASDCQNTKKNKNLEATQTNCLGGQFANRGDSSSSRPPSGLFLFICVNHLKKNYQILILITCLNF